MSGHGGVHLPKPEKPNYALLPNMGQWHYGMIFGSLALGLLGSSAPVASEYVTEEVNTDMVLLFLLGLLLWVAGALVMYYVGSRPAYAFVLKKHRNTAATILYVVLMCLPLLAAINFGGTREEWIHLIRTAMTSASAIGFVALANSLLKEQCETLKLDPLEHGVLLYEDDLYRIGGKGVLVEQGGPILARSGFSVDPQDNQKEQDADEAQLEIGGTTAVKANFFLETVIDRYFWDEEGQVFWGLEEETARIAFRNSAKVEMRKVASEGFRPGDVAGFKAAADGPYSLWVSWRLAAAKDPREDTDLLRELGWTDVDPVTGHVPWRKGIEFFTKNQEELERRLKEIVESPSRAPIEEENGKRFVGRIFGITDTVGPEQTEKVFDVASAVHAFHRKTKKMDPNRVHLGLVAQGLARDDRQQTDINVTGMSGSSVLVTGGGAAGLLAARGGQGKKNKGKKSGGGKSSGKHGGTT